MVDLTGLHKHFILEHLKSGEVAVDFTMGNGNDTLFLSKTVGEEGRVYAFDIQEEALVSTKRHLEENGAPENYTLICASHHRVKEFVKEPIKAGMFNLGYLPRSGRKAVTTLRETTMPAVEAVYCFCNRLVYFFQYIFSCAFWPYVCLICLDVLPIFDWIVRFLILSCCC